MQNYSLSALLKLREHKKSLAESQMHEALEKLHNEQKKLLELKQCLKDTISARAQLQNKFFLKAQSAPCNQREVSCHISSRQKSVGDEMSLRQSLKEQTDMVNLSAFKLEIAKNSLMDAHKHLRLIEKHHASWQQAKKHVEDKKQEYENDDQNIVRFFIKKA